MMKSHKPILFFLLLAVAVLLLSALVSCVSSEPTSTIEPACTPVPTTSSSAGTTETPEPPSETLEAQNEEEAGDTLVLLSATPAPTATPMSLQN